MKRMKVSEASIEDYERCILEELAQSPWEDGHDSESKKVSIEQVTKPNGERQRVLVQTWAAGFEWELSSHATLGQYRFVRFRMQLCKEGPVWAWARVGNTSPGTKTLLVPKVDAPQDTQLAKDWRSLDLLLQENRLNHVAIIWAFRIAEVTLNQTLVAEGLSTNSRETFYTRILKRPKIEHIFGKSDLRQIHSLKKRRDKICHEVHFLGKLESLRPVQSEINSVAEVANTFVRRFESRPESWGHLGRSTY